MKRILAWVAIWLYACAPVTPLSCTPTLPGPVVIDATVDGGCETLDKITESRLIRNPDGTALVIHCLDGGP